MFRSLFTFFIYFLLIGCSDNRSGLNTKQQINTERSSFDGDDLDEIEVTFPDDTYAATVDYYNPNTGNSSTYSLDVEVVNNSVTVIHFSNGGWLDETHIISGGELDESGSTEIESDKGYIYTITIDR